MQELARYEADSGKEIVITDDDIRWVLAGNQGVTNEEMKLFIELCTAHRLDPFIKEAYIIKYGNSPATIVIGKEVWLKRALRNPRYRGHQAGLTFLGVDGKIRRREGSMITEGEVLLGAWAKVYIDGFIEPIYDEVAFNEYVGKKKNGETQANWRKMPGTMIRKVALVHALREAFPDEFSGCYDAAEMDSQGEAITLGSEPIALDAEVSDVPNDESTVRIPMYEEPSGFGPEGWDGMGEADRMAFVESVASRPESRSYSEQEMKEF